MQGANKERWKVLLRAASVEQDPEKLHELIKEINDLLAAKESRLGQSAEDVTCYPVLPFPPNEGFND